MMDMIIGMNVTPETRRTAAPGTRFDYACSMCGRAVMLARSGQRRQKKDGLRVICVLCAFQRVTEQDFIEFPTTAQLLADLQGEN